MARNVAISEAEAIVMEVLWRESPITSERVIAALSGKQDWLEPTIKTLLGRLLAKGAIRAERQGRRFLYSPLLARDQWLSSESKKLLNRLFGGRIAPLVAHFSRHDQLSKKEIADLKRLIAELDDDT